MATLKSNAASLFSTLAVLGAFLGVISVPCAPASAQNVLTSYSQVGTVTASTTSYDFRFTRHSSSTGGRGSRPHIYYTWDAHLDQATTQALSLPLSIPQQVTTAGTFYGPTYSATAGGQVSVTNTPTQAILSVNYTASTTITTALAAHQSVMATVHPSSVFTFTIPADTDATLTAYGDSGGFVYMTGEGTTLLSLSGAGGPVFLDTPLSPGTYYMSSNLAYSSEVSTQLGTVTDPGKTLTSWGFTLTLTPNGDNGTPGGAGGG